MLPLKNCFPNPVVRCRILCNSVALKIVLCNITLESRGSLAPTLLNLRQHLAVTRCKLRRLPA